ALPVQAVWRNDPNWHELDDVVVVAAALADPGRIAGRVRILRDEQRQEERLADLAVHVHDRAGLETWVPLPVPFCPVVLREWNKPVVGQSLEAARRQAVVDPVTDLAGAGV